MSAVERGGFSNINSNQSELKITADYHKFTVWGNIEISFEEINGEICASVAVYAKKDNIYAIAQDPSEKILLAFKKQLSDVNRPSEYSDIPDQIKKLSALRDTGALTEVEFESKKAELLARI